MYDILILNGKIISGLGNPWLNGDVAVVKDKIVKIGRLSREEAAKVINARGFFVSPGFIVTQWNIRTFFLDSSFLSRP